MTITNTAALFLLLAIPVVWYIGWPRHAFRRLRDATSLILRTVIVLLLVLGLAGTQIVQSADKLAVIFLVDVSDSVGAAARADQRAYIETAVAERRPEDEFGIILFGAEAHPERTVSPVTEFNEFSAAPNPGNTNLAAAINMALGMFPADAARRIVILSDGVPTIGDTQQAAELAAATGVEISYVLFSHPPSPEVQLVRVDAPETVTRGQQFDLGVTIESNVNARVGIQIFSNGQPLYDSRETDNPFLDLREGTNSFTFTLRAQNTGPQSYRVLLNVDDGAADGYVQNNTLWSFTNVTGPPRILLMSTSRPGDAGDEAQFLVPALAQAGLDVERVTPATMPGGVQNLVQYDSIILVNVPARALTGSQMQDIATYVSDLGGGLVVIGGPDSYGPGFYQFTPLEDALPVDMQIRDQERLPQLTIVYLIDRSGSMGITTGSGIPHIELAKEAIIRSMEFLQPTDRVAIASFDNEASLIAPFQDVLDRRLLQRQVATLRAGGGTDILAGMNLIAEQIILEPSQRRHIILLTDGGANEAGLMEVTQRLYDEYGVTTSVIAIGAGAAQFLQRMADAGHGAYHHVLDASSIPTIFTQETVLATRSYILEEPFFPTMTANNPIMSGINAMPSLQGYVATTPKTAAQVVLRGPEPYEDPILTVWQYGLGRSVAFTSDATGRWGVDWVTWDDYSRFWGQVVQWSITEGADNIETRVAMEGDTARIIVDARTESGGFLNGLDLDVRVTDPEGRSHVPNLRQIAPGRYEAQFTPSGEGAYFIAVSRSVDDAVEFRQVTGWVMSYSAEYNIGDTDDRVLVNMANLTGGQALGDEPELVFSHNIESRDVSTPIWPWLLLAAVMILPFDIAVRRLIITRSDLARLQAWMTRRRDEANVSMSERISSLRAARERARKSTGYSESGAPAPSSTVGALRRSKSARAEQDAQQPAQVPVESEPVKPRISSRTQAEVLERNADQNVAGRLLKRRRQRDVEGENE